MSEKIKLVQRVEFIKEACRGKKVLHLGCTDYPFTERVIASDMLLHFKLAEIASELYGFDFDQAGIDILRTHGVQNIYRADLEKLDEVDLNEKFDVIIAGEMIEHLSNPGLFLRGIRRFMKADASLIITTINAYGGLRFALYSLRGKGGTNESVHPDHVSYYSYSTLNLILKRENFRVREFYFYDIGPEHRQHLPWHYKIVNDVCVKVSPQLADGVIAVCNLG